MMALIFIFAGMKVLMVCLGNICRSPLAEGVLQHKTDMAGWNWTVDSAGTLDFHAGSAPHALSQQVARENGVDISQQKARPFVAADFTRFDVIFAMDNLILAEIKKIAGSAYVEEKAKLFLNELHPGKNHDLKDPYYGPASGFQEVYDLVVQTCDAIMNNYRPSTNQ